jgi:hypothetical protein
MSTAKTQIRKIKNFEGYWMNCEHCGKNIKHGFSINGKGCYGSECVVNLVAEKSIRTASTQIKGIMKRIKYFAKHYAITPAYYNRMAELEGLSFDEYHHQYINGLLNN